MILVFKEQLHIICFIYEDTIQEYFFQSTTNTNFNVDEYSKKRINFMLTKKKKEDMFFFMLHMSGIFFPLHHGYQNWYSI